MLRILSRYNSSDYNYCDIVSLGTDGLLKTINNPNIELDKFENYGIKRINGEILNGLKKINWQRKITINIDDAISFLEADSDLYNPLNILITQERNNLLNKYILQLTPIEQNVLTLNFFKDLSLIEISKKLKLTVRRISQIKKSALEKLRNKLSAGDYFIYLTSK